MSDQDQGQTMNDQGKSVQANDDFGFEIDADLIGEELAAAESSPSAGMAIPDENTEHEIPGSVDVEPAKGKSGGNGLLIGGGVLVLLLMLGGVGYMGMTILGGGKPASGPSPNDFAQHTSQPASGGASAFGNGDISMDGSGWGADAGSPAWGEESSAMAPGFGGGANTAGFGNEAPAASVGAGTNDPALAALNPVEHVQPSGQPTFGSEPVPANVIEITHGADEPFETMALSEEELMYDQLLAKADQIEAPAEAIVIDQSVIQRQMNSRRFQELESQVEASRNSIGTMQEAVGDMANEVKNLSQLVEQSTSSQKQLAERVDQLAKTVESINSQPDMADMKTLINRIADQATNAQRTANRALENSGAAVQGNTPRQSAAASAPAPARRPAAPAQAATRSPAPAPKPTAATQAPAAAAPAPAVAATAPAPAPAPAAPAGCDVATVSNLWSVKGVNATSAYIVRKSDKAGVFLRAGIEVPGFGKVVSFNPDGRFICTTSGMIGR